MADPLHPCTLTHARLRRAQGDTSGAIQIVETLIDRGDESDALWALYVDLGGEFQRPHTEPEPPSLADRSSAESGNLTERFRAALGASSNERKILRLERVLARMRER